ncbi:MAG: hypothetical protein RSE32_13560 [Comamonas sp.]|uniref:phage adaptor protein n=1 Tax=Comamonas sp. TaxID=34028 RepID=UPI002FC90E74
MNLEQLLEASRVALQDQHEPYLWADEVLVGYLNEAVQEACERAKLIEDATTDAVCRIPVIAGRASYALHSSVLEARRIAFNGRVLTETSFQDLDAHDHAWETRQGTPNRFIFEQATSAAVPVIRLVPAPAIDGFLRLTVYRGALKPLIVGVETDTPEIADRFHVKLIDWVCRCAYLRPDPDGYDPNKGQTHEALFERNFGARPDANVQRKRRDKHPRIVKMKGSW